MVFMLKLQVKNIPFLRYHSQPGIIAKVTTIMALGAINVSTMKVFHSAKNANAVMIICTDSPIPSDFGNGNL